MPADRGQPVPWTQELHQDSLVGSAGEDDFTKFLELETDFNQFDNLDQQNGPSGLDTPMSRLAFNHPGQMQNMGLDMASLSSPHISQDFTQMQQNGQQYQQYPMYQQMQQGYRPQVPPTPVSAEMNGAKYGAQMQFDRQQTAFTPLVSPAQTPLDQVWSMSDYIGVDDFFSPLTSPAIEAQQYFTSTNTTSSPVDLNAEPGTGDGPGSLTRKGRRKLNPSSRTAIARTVKQSPSMKPQTRRRQASLTSIPIDKIDNMINDPAQASRLKPRSVNRAPSSEESVSPEHLSEALMKPPPVPQIKSPTSTGRSKTGDNNAPATPATLMMIPGKQPVVSIANDRHGASANSDVMEDISLPDSAAELSMQSLPQGTARLDPGEDQSTPTIPAKTPKLSAESTPRSAGLKASSNSQESLNKFSRGGRTGKKRQSVPSAAISPALRPKISPSISPLVPSSAQGMPMISAETSALYLASKSNYQNILDGTHLPGVSYPDTLAENLSSKRTSHKIAEQGRRNRINLALKEIESLLPPAITAAAAKKEKANSKEENGEGNEKSSAAQGASKASTVEMAIVYIKALQSELEVTKEKLLAAEKKITEGNSSGSQTSE